MPANEVIIGETFSFATIELTFGVVPIAGIKGISYDDDLKRANVWGTGSIQIGLTRGTYLAKGSIEFYKNAFLIAVIAQLGVGWRQTPLSVVVTYGPNGNGLLQVDTLPQILLGATESANEFSEDGAPLTNKVSFYAPVPILWNGVPSVIETFPLIAVA